MAQGPGIICVVNRDHDANVAFETCQLQENKGTLLIK